MRTSLKYQSPEMVEFEANYFGSASNLLAKKLNERSKRLESAELSYRIISYWEKEGVMNVDRGNEKGWRRYSIMDFVWLQIVLELRKFGLPIDVIKHIRKELTDQESEGELVDRMQQLEAYIAAVLHFKYAAFLLVFPSGIAIAVTQTEMTRLGDFLVKNPYVAISLNMILTKIFKRDYFAPVDHPQLSLEHRKLLQFLSSGTYHAVNIHFKDGKIDRFEGEEFIETSARIMDVLNTDPYLKVEVIKAAGKVAKIKKTVSKKL